MSATSALKAKALLKAKPASKRRDATKAYCQGSAVLSIVIVSVILLTLLIQSLPVLMSGDNGLIGTQWNPDEGQFGIIAPLFGSVFVMIIATVIAFPIGLLTAIYISETRSSKLRRLIKSILELLAGIPSIVYGLIGVAYLNIWVADLFDLQSGRIILTAGILLGIMILPTFLTLTEDALSAVPQRYRENAKSLGMYRHEVFKDIIFPQAKVGIAGAGLLALGRALGETMAVMLVIGSLDRLPSPLFNPLSSGQTITSKLGREVGESAFGSVHFSALVFMSFILVSITIALTILSHYFLTRKPSDV
ncbi:phosphate ABC transporter permease subunit PstC [Hellea sp.]|nr:phosphate ABC transporter permease subunit PstC [Hellea sp.]